MTVYKRPDSPYWLIEFVYKGERHRFSSETPSKAKAVAREADEKKKLRDQVVTGKLPEMTLADAFVRYAKTVVKLNRSNGVRETSAFSRLLAHFGAETLLSEITTPKITKFQEALLFPEEGEGLRPASINRYVDLFKAVLYKAQDAWGVLARVPAIPALKVKNINLRFLSEAEEEKLLEVAPPHLRRLLVFLLGTGGRLGETLSLTWEHVNLSDERASVRFVNTKTDKPRRVPLPKPVRNMLIAMRAAAGDDVSPKARVFTWVRPGTAEAVALDSVNNSFVTARKASGIVDRFSLHTMRHTYASRLVMRGTPILQVSKLLGHAKIQMTMRYAHLAPEGLDDAVAVLDT